MKLQFESLPALISAWYAASYSRLFMHVPPWSLSKLKHHLSGSRPIYLLSSPSSVTVFDSDLNPLPWEPPLPNDRVYTSCDNDYNYEVGDLIVGTVRLYSCSTKSDSQLHFTEHWLLALGTTGIKY